MKQYKNLSIYTPPYRKNAFTLAEVLITLVIIGVIAAITVPTLIHKMRREEVETKLKRVYSVMNQAINMSKIDNGDFKQWDYSAIDGTYEGNRIFFDKYIGKYLKTMKIEKESGSEAILVYFLDGSLLRISPNIRDMVYFTNSHAINNEYRGRNLFSFRFAPVKQLLPSSFTDEDAKYNLNKGFDTYAYRWNGTIEHLKNSSSFGCYANRENPGYCARLIQANGWKVPDDYPYL